MRECMERKEDLKLYVDDKEKKAKIKLDLTTNPLGFPKGVLSSLKKITQQEIMHYGEPSELPELKNLLAQHSGVSENQVMVTAGADQAIEIVLTHLLDPGNRIGILIPNFPRFEIVARRICDAEVTLFNSLAEIPDCDVVVLCTPNNPTTKEMGVSEIEAVMEKNEDKFFVIDNVFSAFSDQNMSSLLGRFENLVVLKSLSKSFGIAGLRVGWLESKEKNIRLFRKGVCPFRVPFICQKLAVEALKDKKHLEKTSAFLQSEFDKIQTIFGDRAQRESNVPFFLFFVDDSEKAKDWLLKEGISVVDSSSFKGAEREFLRIMIGKPDENKILIEKLQLY